MTVVLAVAALAVWFVVAVGLGLFLGRVFTLGEEPQHPFPGEHGWRQTEDGNWLYSAGWLDS